jgi:hypothetical protein
MIAAPFQGVYGHRVHAFREGTHEVYAFPAGTEGVLHYVLVQIVVVVTNQVLILVAS